MNAGIPEGHLALDSSVLVEMLTPSERGSRLNQTLLERKAFAHVSNLNLAEAEYILCRRIGYQEARKRITSFVESGFVLVEEDARLLHAAARIKCERAISMADCYTVAVAENTGAKAVFAFKEAELQKEMDRKPFASQIIFLED